MCCAGSRRGCLLLLLGAASSFTLVTRPAPAGWVVVHTWPWTTSALAAASVLSAGGSALDAARPSRSSVATASHASDVRLLRVQQRLKTTRTSTLLGPAGTPTLLAKRLLTRR